MDKDEVIKLALNALEAGECDMVKAEDGQSVGYWPVANPKKLRYKKPVAGSGRHALDVAPRRCCRIVLQPQPQLL